MKNNMMKSIVIGWILFATILCASKLITKAESASFEIPTVADNINQNDNSTNSTTNGTIVLDFQAGAKNTWSYVILAFFIIVCMNTTYQMKNNPWVKVRKINTIEYTDLGRWFHDEFDAELRMYRWYMKTEHGIEEVYSRENFNGIRKFLMGDWMIIHEYPYLAVRSLKLPESVKRYKKNLPSRKFWHVIYRIVSIFPQKKLSLRIYNKFEDKKERITHIQFVEPSQMQEHLGMEFVINYERREVTTNKDEITWVPVQNERIDAGHLLVMKKTDGIQNVKIVEYKPIKKYFDSVAAALEAERIVNDIRALFEYQKISDELEINCLNSRVVELSNELVRLKNQSANDVANAIQNIDQKTRIGKDRLIDLIGKALNYTSMGFEEVEAIKMALSEKSEKEHQLETEIARQKAISEYIQKQKEQEFQYMVKSKQRNTVVIADDGGDEDE